MTVEGVLLRETVSTITLPPCKMKMLKKQHFNVPKNWLKMSKILQLIFLFIVFLEVK